MLYISKFIRQSANQISKLFRNDYQPLIEVRIFKDAILHNLEIFRSAYPKVSFAPVLKSNAYGHGLKEVGKILDDEGCPFFVVDSFYEALVLRREGTKTKILVLGYATVEQINSNLENVSYALIDLKQIQNLNANLKRKIYFHLKVDTGMHRQGILENQIAEAAQIIQSNKNFILEGLCSHFADADGESDVFTKLQIQKWGRVVSEIKNKFSKVKYFHTSNTAGAFFLPDINANVGRLGIGLYGFNTSQFSQLKLKPALEMYSIITSVKTVLPGEKIGYNNTYEVLQKTTVATVPVGYNEGLDVRLSNKGFFKIGGIFCPIVGKVSMNMCSVDVSMLKKVELEDPVQIISSKNEDLNSIENIVKICETNRYGVPIRIPQYLKRVVL